MSGICIDLYVPEACVTHSGSNKTYTLWAKYLEKKMQGKVVSISQKKEKKAIDF
ncbi:hypothetical protein [Cyclobacterium xiamenense]|uniref:hypothetical protein n=1 Tax=Cyclobacterium xiamenense TaxID=1297121 RepID=UPI0035D026C1